MMRDLGCITLVCLAVLSAAACGSDSDDGAGGSCKRVDACGGAVRGTWKVESACYFVERQPDLMCQGGAVELEVDSASGTFVFDEDTYSLEAEVKAVLHVTYPKSCRDHAGETQSCDFFEGTIQGRQVTCTEASSGDCKCDLDFPVSLDESSIYSISGDQLDLQQSGDTDYCVDGKRITIEHHLEADTSEDGEVLRVLQTTAVKQ